MTANQSDASIHHDPAHANYHDQLDHNDTHIHSVTALSDSDIAERIATANAHCTKQGVRFTPLRERVYRLILQADKPIGAYDLMQQVQDERTEQARQTGDTSEAKRVAPPTVYRTLEFLLEQGFIHQLTSKNAYVPCCHPRHAHTAIFLLCKSCEAVQEFGDLSVSGLLADIKQLAGFAVQDGVMEFQGLCAKCQVA